MADPAGAIDDAEILAKRRAIEEARQAIREGRTVRHEDVRRWLLSWGTENELPRPTCK